ncbi:MAG: hypothetical protein QNJ60_02635 [Xenococcaceae cyanobacterium MO_188.B19]|nr:hypothetical protein [Xenococcaceae cyanobacterium MO_188.B19]
MTYLVRPIYLIYLLLAIATLSQTLAIADAFKGQLSEIYQKNFGNNCVI